MVRNSEEFPTLVAQYGPLEGQRWALKASVTIGRDRTCDIVIPSRQVSRYHARLTPTPEGTELEDMTSRNGTHCNGHPVLTSIALQDGDAIQIALAQQFIYVSSDATLPLDGSTKEIEALVHRLRLDKRSRRVWIGDEEVSPPLSVSQFQLLETLYDRQGRVVPRTELIKAVWGEEDAVGVSEQALDALVRRLRDRLAATDPTHIYVVTVRGHGLRLDNPTLDR